MKVQKIMLAVYLSDVDCLQSQVYMYACILNSIIHFSKESVLHVSRRAATTF